MTRQLARSPYLAGDAFTAADISVTYALQLARELGGVALGEAEHAYLARVGEREGYDGPWKHARPLGRVRPRGPDSTEQ